MIVRVSVVVVVIVYPARVLVVHADGCRSGGGVRGGDPTGRVFDHWRVPKEGGRVIGHQRVGSPVRSGVQVIGREHGEARGW